MITAITDGCISMPKYLHLCAFAGIWTDFKGDRGTKSKPVPSPHVVYGFVTTSPNAVVQPIHPKAMPVILTNDGERDVWMRGRRGRSDLRFPRQQTSVSPTGMPALGQ